MKRLLMLIICASVFTSGCAVNFYKTTPKDKTQIESLKGEVDRLTELRNKENRQFERIKNELERKLHDKRVGLEVQNRGLVITLADNILFDSGKADVKDEAYEVLDNIIGVLNNSAAEKNIGVEGHTDNVPITHSGWKSNRELSTARANNVYHYLVDKGVNPSRLATMGYGEYRPVATNDTKEGRAKNRRVEIVILPEFSKKTDASDQMQNNWAK